MHFWHHGAMFEKIAEEKIREAMANGEFDNLEGKGKPLSHDAYFAVPEDLRLAHSVLKSNNFVPLEVDLLRDLYDLRQKLATAATEDERRLVQREINDVQLRLDIERERMRKKRRRL